MNRIENHLWTIVLGSHPRNTIFSFNFHNVNHIISYLKKCSSRLGNVNCMVDIGAGRSPYYYIFEKNTNQFIAIDMKESLPPTEIRNIIQKYGVAEELPIESSVVDVALSNQVLEHVINVEKSIKEIYRILKPGGYIIGSVPHISPVHLEPYDFRRFTDLGVNKLLQDEGFIDIEIEGNGSIYRAMAFSVAMDWMLSPRVEGEPQIFSPRRALFLSPVVGIINSLAIFVELMAKDKKRSPANICWIARKPLE